MNIYVPQILLIGATVAVFPLIYTGVPFDRLTGAEQKKIKYGRLTMILPFMYALTYLVLTVLLLPYFDNKRTRMFVLGAIAGFIYSLVGHFIMRVPEKIYKSRNPNLVHLYAPIVYSLIYGVVVYKIEEIINSKPNVSPY